MRVIREEDSTRLRSSLRGLFPAAATLVLLLAGAGVLGPLLDAIPEAGSAGEALLGLATQVVLFVVLIGIAVRGATKLDRRHYTEFGLNVDGGWARDFAAGALISVSATFLSTWWATFRGFREIDLAAGGVSGPGGPIVLGGVVTMFIAFSLVQNLYEEIVYRGIMLQNFIEGLVGRGFSPASAVVSASVASLVLFGMYHFPLRGSVVVVIDAAVVGIPFALAYLLTGEVGLPVGVHFGRVPLELMYGVTIAEFELAAIVELRRDALPANLEVTFVHLGLTCLFVLAWVYLVEREIRVAGTIGRQNRNRSDTD